MKKEYKSILKIVGVLAVLIFIFLKTYSIHFENKYPEHVDEWQHLAISKQILDKGFVDRRPYFKEDLYHFDFEPGFHLFLAGLMLIDKNLILHYKYLPAIFATLSVLTLFLFMLKIFKNYNVALFSIMFFASLKSSVNILGLNFFTPLTMSIPFMFLFLWLFIDSLNQNDIKKFLISFLVLLCIIFIHPPSALILLPAIVIELILKYKFIAKHKFKVLLALLSVLLPIIYYLGYIWWGHLGETRNLIFELLVFKKGFTPVEISYFLPYLYGVVAFIIALFGVYAIFKDKKDRTIIIFALTTLLLLFIFNNFDFSLFAPYQRVLYYSMLSLVPLSAYGLNYIIIKTKNLLKKNKFKEIILSLIVIVVFILVFTSKYSVVDNNQVYTKKVINDNEYNALIWLKSNYEKHNVIMAPVTLSSAIYPISENYVVSIVPAQISGGNYQDNINFYRKDSDCYYKDIMINKNNVDFVISENEISCNFLKEIYNKEIYIYKFEKA